MGADRHVMGDLDQIVDLGTLHDDCCLAKYCGPIDRDICAEFGVILDRDSAELGNLVMPSLVLHIAESVASDHRATVNDHSRSDRTAFPDDDVRIQERIVPDRCIVADKDTGIECHSRANPNPVS